MCAKYLPSNAMEAIDPVDSDFDELMAEAIDYIGIPTDQEIHDAFSDDEIEPDICPTNGIGCSGCHNCR